MCIMIIRLEEYGRISMLLSNEKKKEISDLTIRILNKHHISPYNFDILWFVSKVYGFKIESRLFDDPAVTGTLLVDDDTPIYDNIHKLISVNSNVVNGQDGFERTCYITLHELAHYLLHKKDHRQYAKRDTSQRNTTEEMEADYFASCMMMPEDALKSIVSTCIDDQDKVETVRRVFSVTEKKAIVRLKEFSLINRDY